MFRDSDLEPVPDPSKAGLDAVTSTVDNHSNFTSLPNMWRVFTDRKAVIQDIDRMDVEDEYVSTALDIIADFAVCYDDEGEAQINITANAPEDQKIIDDLMARLDIKLEAWQIIRDMVKYGFAPREALIDREKMKIVGLKQTISYQIYPKCTEKGDKVPGWTVMTDKDIYNGVGGTDLEEWQIIPFSYGARRGYLSVPILAAARRNWARLSKIEDGMAVARLTRAYDKLIHRVPVKDSWVPEEITKAVKKYKDAITKRKIQSNEGFVSQNENPIDVQTDFFLPDTGDGRGGVDTLTSTNLQLGNLNDVYYSRERLVARLRVPVSYLQMSSAQKTHLKAGGAVSDVDIQFGRFLRGIHANFRRSLRRVIDLELLINSRSPSNAYKIEMPEVETNNPMEEAKIELTKAQAATFFVEAFGALPPAIIAAKFMELTDSQQALMDTFLKASGDKILKARMDALAAPPKIALNPASAGGGSKSPAKKKAKKQSLMDSVPDMLAEEVAQYENPQEQDSGEDLVPLDAATDLFMTLAQKVNAELRKSGMPVPELANSYRDEIRQQLLDLAISDAN